jgi:hypothetical protein
MATNLRFSLRGRHPPLTQLLFLGQLKRNGLLRHTGAPSAWRMYDLACIQQASTKHQATFSALACLAHPCAPVAPVRVPPAPSAVEQLEPAGLCACAPHMGSSLAPANPVTIGAGCSLGVFLEWAQVGCMVEHRDTGGSRMQSKCNAPDGGGEPRGSQAPSYTHTH